MSRTIQKRVKRQICTAAILAGGHARRLRSTDKAKLLVGGEAIIKRELHVLHDVVTVPPCIVTDDPKRYAETGLTILTDHIPNTGALGGLYTAVAEAPETWVLIVACDMPFLSASFLRYLLSIETHADAIIPKSEAGYHPLCALYSRRCEVKIHQSLTAGNLVIKDFLNKINIHEIGPQKIAQYDPFDAILLNVNTPHDYERAKSLAPIIDKKTSKNSTADQIS